MCVDDYQFRHYSAVRPKECRRFIFINEDEIQKRFLVNISQFEQNGEVALCRILFHLSNKGLPIANTLFYWPKYNISIQPGDYCKVPFSALSDKQILFKTIFKLNDFKMPDQEEGFNENYEIQEIILQKNQHRDYSMREQKQCNLCSIQQKFQDNCTKKTQQNNESSNQSNKQHSPLLKEQDSPHKRIKQPERRIAEVIIAVKKWRRLYQSKTLNLTKAAKLLGISKKSLDDYYLVLRVGEILEFDYSANLNLKMGDLRAFIRTFDYKVTGKLSKQVKCFDLVPDFDVHQIMEQEYSHDEVQHIEQN